MRVSTPKLTRQVFVSVSLIATLLTLGACKVGGSGGARTVTADNVIVLSSYRRLASASKDFSDYNSMFTAQALLADEGVSLEAYADPPEGCRLASQPSGVQISASRALDLGDLVVSAGEAAARLAKDPESYGIGYYLALEPGTYSLKNVAFPNAMQLNHTLTVVEPSNSILIDSGAHVDQILPLLGTVAEGDPGFTTQIDKSEGLVIDVAAPAGTTYVYVELFDGTYHDNGTPSDASDDAPHPDHVIACVGRPNAPITIEPSLMDGLVKTSDPAQSLAYLTVDLVSSERKTLQGKLTDSVVKGYTRMIQGAAEIDIQNNEGKRRTVLSPYSRVVIE